jgi:hypothetical protein
MPPDAFIYTGLRKFCFAEEIATLLTLSSLQFAVAVGRNHTCEDPWDCDTHSPPTERANADDPAHEL